MEETPKKFLKKKRPKNQEANQSALTALQAAFLTVMNKISQKKILVSENPSFVPIVQQKTTIEQNIKIHQLKQARIEKKRLHEKLMGVEQNIKQLTNGLQKRRAQSLSKEEQVERVLRNEEYSKKMMEESLQRQQRLKERRRIEMKKIQDLEKAEIKQKKKEQKKKKQEKQAKRSQFQQRFIQRKVMLDLNSPENQIEKYFYQKKQQEYQKLIDQKRIKKTQKNLEKRKNYMHQIDWEQLLYDSKQYQETLVKKQSERQKRFQNSTLSQPIPISRMAQSLLQQDRLQREIIQKKEKQRKELQIRKSKYSKIIHQLYQPQIDKKKKKEMELIKEKLANPVKRRTSFSPRQFHSFTPSVAKVFRTSPVKQVSGKKTNHSTVDWLADRRKFRFKLAENLIKDKKAFNKGTQHMIKYLNTQDAADNRIISIENQLTENLLSQVRSKISQLNYLT